MYFDQWMSAKHAVRWLKSFFWAFFCLFLSQTEKRKEIGFIVFSPTCISIFFHVSDGKRWKNLFRLRNKFFWPANGMGSTRSLVKIHNILCNQVTGSALIKACNSMYSQKYFKYYITTNVYSNFKVNHNTFLIMLTIRGIKMGKDVWKCPKLGLVIYE